MDVVTPPRCCHPPPHGARQWWRSIPWPLGPNLWFEISFFSFLHRSSMHFCMSLWLNIWSSILTTRTCCESCSSRKKRWPNQATSLYMYLLCLIIWSLLFSTQRNLFCGNTLISPLKSQPILHKTCDLEWLPVSLLATYQTISCMFF